MWRSWGEKAIQRKARSLNFWHHHVCPYFPQKSPPSKSFRLWCHSIQLRHYHMLYMQCYRLTQLCISQVDVCFWINSVLCNATDFHSCVFPPTGVGLFLDKLSYVTLHMSTVVYFPPTGVCLFWDKHCPIQHYRCPQLCISLAGACLFLNKLHPATPHMNMPYWGTSPARLCL